MRGNQSTIYKVKCFAINKQLTPDFLLINGQ